MANQNWIKLLGCCVLAAPLALSGCKGDDEGGNEEVGATDTTDGTDSSTTTSDTTTDTSTTNGTTTADTTADTDTMMGEDPFVFASDPPESYARVDRMGMPAIATAVITSKDEYNAANPSDDVMATFVNEITTNVVGLHAALDDDLLAAAFTPCNAIACGNQAVPLIVPDTLKINLTDPPGFPNGRMLADPVIDVTLAVVLLDLNMEDVLTFANLPLNPPANDVPFSADFPYLADPN